MKSNDPRRIYRPRFGRVRPCFGKSLHHVAPVQAAEPQMSGSERTQDELQSDAGAPEESRRRIAGRLTMRMFCDAFDPDRVGDHPKRAPDGPGAGSEKLK